MKFLQHHSIAKFEGPKSRSHEKVPLWKLWLQAKKQRILRPRDRPDSFVQFIGFPRSGHSLVGAILNARERVCLSHELDAMGLLLRGFSPSDIFSLIRWHEDLFERNGRYWNNFQYNLEFHEPKKSGGPVILGDKKGDWTARHLADSEHSVDSLSVRLGVPIRWILVLRNPFDNISTLSLRLGREYDRIRIETKNEIEFKSRIAEVDDRIVPKTIRDEMIEDYFGLCDSINRVKIEVDPNFWFELDYEQFKMDTALVTEALCGWLSLPCSEDYKHAVRKIVRRGGNPSRYDIAWSKNQKALVSDRMKQYTFLSRFSDDFDS